MSTFEKKRTGYLDLMEGSKNDSKGFWGKGQGGLGFEMLIWPSGMSLALPELTPLTGESNCVFLVLFHDKSVNPEELFLRMLLFCI